MKNHNSGTAFLHRMDEIQHEVRKAYERKAELEARATSTNIHHNGIGGSCRGHSDKAGHGAILIVEQEEKIKRLREEYSLMWKMLYSFTKQIDDCIGVSVLSLRFTAEMRLNDIPQALNISRATMFRCYKNAVNELSVLLDASKEKEVQSLIRKVKNR